MTLLVAVVQAGGVAVVVDEGAAGAGEREADFEIRRCRNYLLLMIKKCFDNNFW
jgi:hypothetical protein